MKKWSSRDWKLFLFGMLTAFLLVLIYDWKEFVRGFNDGISDAIESHR